MFIPKSFAQHDEFAIQEFIAQHPLATIIATTPNGLEASHVPMQWVQQEEGESQCHYLLGHIAKVNPLNDTDVLTTQWLVVFQDAGHYISPNWYPSKAETHKQVPTWNYRAVHITGKPRKLTDSGSLMTILTRLTEVFEATEIKPWSLKDAPDKYIQGLCKAIVGIRIDFDPDHIKAQFKLSQNKSKADREGVIAGLKAVGTPESLKMASLIALD
ncbi:FMN-binding negative transcriptional regulator [Psychrobacter sp. YP14]|uniref:FMN-binding negative transcriptional regulator n=1 Tax=Psychrobacter sp. YP14 TaxID=2203895 RepID=UPI0013A67C3F|nr:FMN-binding negative transcriptional regulator [Psychrobacter sp. YP14]